MENKAEQLVLRLAKEGLFTIYKNGTIMRHGQMRGGKFKRGKSRVARLEDVRGCIRVFIKVDGKGHYLYAHRLIWQHYKGKIPKNRRLYHKNGNKSDNRLSNLRLDHFVPSGEGCPASKITEKEVVEIRKRYYEGDTQKKISKDMKISVYSICPIVHGLTWKDITGAHIVKERHRARMSDNWKEVKAVVEDENRLPKNLTQREVTVLKLRCIKQLKFEDIGKKLKFTRQCAFQICKRGERKLREAGLIK